MFVCVNKYTDKHRTVPFSQKHFDFRNSIAFWKVPRLRPFVLMAKKKIKINTEHWMNIIDKENQRARRKTCLSTTLSNTKITRTDLVRSILIHLTYTHSYELKFYSLFTLRTTKCMELRTYKHFKLKSFLYSKLLAPSIYAKP
jgi:hypothetical protein